ncbi:hypothetical protein KJ603_00470 [Patescibacteria group bacterium]|nr:hypothetical protein [Patescibacteria group bacterium]
MIEKIYPLVIWFSYKGEKQLYSKITVASDEPRNIRIANTIATAIQSLKFGVPIEISLFTQSSSTPSAIEVNRIEGMNIHTLTEESAVFVLTTENSKLLKVSKDDIRKLFLKKFFDFRRKHRSSVAEKRMVAAVKVRQCDDICKVLDF